MSKNETTSEAVTHADKAFGDRRTNRGAVNAAWLVRLRWVAVIGQLVTIAVAALAFQVKLELAPLLTIVIFTAATNFVLAIWLSLRDSHPTRPLASRNGQLLLAAVMTLDLLSLTGLLYFAGGPTNPFTIFYFVNLALSAVILPARWSWALTGVAIVCLAFLFVDHVELPELERPPDSQRSIAHERLTLGQQGLLVALAAGAIVLIYFITRVTRELSQRENQLRIAEQQRARSEKLEALGTLAAGAGHELATPLSTIAVVAKELTHHLEGVDVPQTVKEDVTLIRSEVDLCRSILDRMKGNVGQAIAEQTKAITIERLIEEVMDGLHQCERVQIDVADGIAERPISLPVQSVAQAIRGVLQNALDASSPNDTVQFTVLRTDAAFRLEVQDRGVGMSEEVLARAGEPFFTTKEPGKGMGLGLFLTRSVVERLGGTLRLYSNREQGVTAVIELPDESASTQPAW